MYIARKIKKSVGSCQVCINQLQASKLTEEHSLIEERDLKPRVLIKTKTQFCRMFSNMTELFFECINKYILHANIKYKLKRI